MENYTLHARARGLLRFLNSRHGIVTAREISEKMSISERTIRSDIAQINQAMEAYGICIRTVYGKGYCLEISDRAVFHRLFFDEKNVQTREDRIRYLILRLVRSKGSCSLQDLEEDIYISRTTLESDLKEVRRRITESRPYLQMDRKGNEIRIEENELKKRDILIHLYCENWDYDSRDGISLKDDVIDWEILNQIRIVLKEMLGKYEIELDDYGLIYLTLALAVCYSRNLEGNILVLPGEWKQKESHEEDRFRLAAEELLHHMEQIWELSIEEDVSAWLSSIIRKLSPMRLQKWDRVKGAGSDEADRADVQLLQTLLSPLEREYGLDLREDEAFCRELLLHFRMIRGGMVPGRVQNGYVPGSLRMRYPYLGDAAHFLCRRAEELLGIRMGQDEENDILPLLLLAQNRRLEMLREERLKIAVVSHLGRGLTGYLMQQLERSYGLRVKLVGPYPVYDRNRMEEERPACIITTVQMDVFRSFDVPVVTVSPQITRSEGERVENAIRQLEKNCLFPGLPRDRSFYFHSDLSFRIQQKASFDEVMEELERRLKQGGYVPDEWSVSREDGYCSLLENGTLFTYASGEENRETVFCMVYLDYPVSWKQLRGIRRVLYLALNPADRRYLGSFYQLAEDIAGHAEGR